MGVPMSRKELEARHGSNKGLVALVRKRRCVSHALAATREATVVHVIYTVMKPKVSAVIERSGVLSTVAVRRAPPRRIGRRSHV